MITEEKKQEKSAIIAKFQPKKYDQLLGMPGFSDKMLRDHFKLYEGYVTNTNTSLEKLNGLLKEGKEKVTEFNEVKRRLGWEFNGMRLHEYYFDNLGAQPLKAKSKISDLLESQFGGFDQWKKDFVATGAMRGIGWVILYQDPQSKQVFNFWIEEHSTNHLAGGNPLVVMDVFEHAYMLDYGTDKAKYIESFFNNLNWGTVEERLER